jgi:hypothetical protein
MADIYELARLRLAALRYHRCLRWRFVHRDRPALLFLPAQPAYRPFASLVWIETLDLLIHIKSFYTLETSRIARIY